MAKVEPPYLGERNSKLRKLRKGPRKDGPTPIIPRKPNRPKQPIGPDGARKPMRPKPPSGTKGPDGSRKPRKPQPPSSARPAPKPKGDGWINMAPPGFPPKWRKKGQTMPRKPKARMITPLGRNRLGK